MTENDVYAGWQKLCKEMTAAQDTWFSASAVVIQKFAAIAKRVSSTNPTNDELLRFEKTRKAGEDIKRRMNEFVKRYA